MGDLELNIKAQGRRMSLLTPVASFLPTLMLVMIAALSLVLFQGRNTGMLPSLVTFAMTLQRLNSRIGSVSKNIDALANNQGRLARLNLVLSTEGKQFRRKGGASFTSLEHQISFQGVGLRYKPELPPALSDLSFNLPKGRMLALVGPSGSGKSSIADLLNGLYSPTQGQILVDGMPLEKIDLTSWQKRLGVVSQDTFLFNLYRSECCTWGTLGHSEKY